MGKELSLQEVLRLNKEKVRRENIQRIKKQRRKEQILTFFIGTFIVVVSLIAMSSLDKESKRAIEKCSKEHSLNYCYKNIG